MKTTHVLICLFATFTLACQNKPDKQTASLDEPKARTAIERGMNEDYRLRTAIDSGYKITRVGPVFIEGNTARAPFLMQTESGDSTLDCESGFNKAQDEKWYLVRIKMSDMITVKFNNTVE